MAQITYGYDAYSSAPRWVTPQLCVDGAINTLYGYFSEKIAWTTRLRVSETVAPGTNLGTITKVEVGVNWYVLGGGTNVFPYIQPEGGAARQFPVTSGVDFVTDYHDLTAESYTWADFPTLWIDFYSYCVDPDLYYNSLSIDWVWLRITYTPTPTGLDLKVHGVDWTNIGKIHGIADSDIAKVHGVS